MIYLKEDNNTTSSSNPSYDGKLIVSKCELPIRSKFKKATFNGSSELKGQTIWTQTSSQGSYCITMIFSYNSSWCYAKRGIPGYDYCAVAPMIKIKNFKNLDLILNSQFQFCGFDWQVIDEEGYALLLSIIEVDGKKTFLYNSDSSGYYNTNYAESTIKPIIDQWAQDVGIFDVDKKAAKQIKADPKMIMYRKVYQYIKDNATDTKGFVINDDKQGLFNYLLSRAQYCEIDRKQLTLFFIEVFGYYPVYAKPIEFSTLTGDEWNKLVAPNSKVYEPLKSTYWGTGYLFDGRARLASLSENCMYNISTTTYKTTDKIDGIDDGGTYAFIVAKFKLTDAVEMDAKEVGDTVMVKEPQNKNYYQVKNIGTIGKVAYFLCTYGDPSYMEYMYKKFTEIQKEA